ncbi:MAG: PAS domain-containing sensor histidine kinase [Candidatus Neomarinimicrobiota bacterium]
MAALESFQKVILESEKKYRTLVESMDDAVFIVNSRGKITFANTRFADLVQYPCEVLIGKHPDTILGGPDNNPLFNSIERVFQSGKTDQTEHLLLVNGKSLWFETSLVPQYDIHGSRVSVLGISRDITVQKQTKVQLEALVATLKSQQDTLKQLSGEVIRAQEKERKRISRELHDEIGQAMTAISFNLQIIQQISGKHGPALWQQVRDCQKLVQDTAQNIHRFSFELRPSLLDDMGLLPAIKAHARRYSERTGIEVTIQNDEAIENTAPEIKTVLYRVFQEGLNNIAKHARADRVTVILRLTDGAIDLKINDNGTGFETTAAAGRTVGRGLGLTGIRERAKLVGGEVTIESVPGTGTSLALHIPYGNA